MGPTCQSSAEDLQRCASHHGAHCHPSSWAALWHCVCTVKLHGRLCWNAGGMTSPQQNLPIGLRLQNALAAELLLSGRDLLVCKEAVPALSDPAEANSPRQQT